MELKERIIDMNETTPEEKEAEIREAQLIFRLNHTMPFTEEYDAAAGELFGELGEGCRIYAPVSGVSFDRISVGKRVIINSNFHAMAQGGISIGDDAAVAANVQLLTNNHDPYERNILTCKPITIGEGAWIGAGATILPGVSVGRYAIVGAASVVTRDVPDFAVSVGNPAKIVKTLYADKFDSKKEG